MKNHITATTMVARIHGHLAKEILHIRHNHGQRSQPVPQVIQSKQSFASGTGRLIFKRNKRTPQLNCLRQVFFNKSIRKMKHVGSSQNWRAFFIKTHVRTKQIPITTQNFFCFRIPYDQLLIGVFHRVVFINIHWQTCTSTSSTESYFTQTTNLSHYIRSILMSNNINLIITLIRHS